MQTRETLRWDEMRLLLALFRSGSLKAAAAALGVNISTVSRRLDSLEDGIDQHLFDRTPEGTRPTAAAELLLPFAEQMEQAALGATQALEGLEAEPEGVVRVTAPPGVADHFLAPSIVDLVKRYPRLRVEIIASIGYADLTRREADIALRSIRPASGDLVATRLGTAAYAVAASPKLAKKIGRLRRLEDASWITYGDDLGHLAEVKWVTDQVPEESIVLRATSITAQLEAVRSGLGVRLEVRPFLGLTGITEVPLAPPLRKSLHEMPEGTLWLVGHRALRNVPRIAAVWEFLQQRFRAALS
jgi:DNA-binding transcriptional LysR family regulator